MRLSSLTLERYGPFRNCVFEFDPAPGRLNLLLAPNGYGKSVVRQALRDLLFGIHPQTPMSYLHGTQQMRLRADIVTAEGARTLVRRKGQGNTLADAAGQEISPAEIKRMLGGADDMLFRELFALDTELLRAGGLSLLQSDGRLGQVLFAGGGGLGRVRGLLDDLVKRRDEIGRADLRQRTKPLWAAVATIEQARNDIRTSAMRPEAWRALEQRVGDAAAALAEIRRTRAAAESRLDRLRLLRAIRAPLKARRDAMQVLAEAGDVPRLDAGFEKIWREALAAHNEAASAASATAQQAEAQRTSHVAVMFDQRLVDAADDIAALTNLRTIASQARADLPQVERQMAEAAAAAARLRGELGWTDEIGLPPAAAVREARQQMNRHAGLAAAAAQATREHAAVVRRQDIARDVLAAMPTPPDLTGAVALVAALRAQGDPAARLEAARARTRQAAAELRMALDDIPGVRLTEAMLETTTSPSAATLALIESDWSNAAAAEQAANGECRRIARETAALEAELASLTARAALPPPDALAQARTRRDRLWSIIHRGNFPDQTGPLDATEIYAAAGDTPLPIAFDRAVHEADAVADALVAHSTEVAQAAALRERLEALRNDASVADAGLAQAAAAVVAAQAALARIAAAAGSSEAPGPTALRDFLAARQAAAERRSALLRTVADEADLTAAMLQQAGLLAASMEPTADLEAIELAGLPALLARVDQSIEVARALVGRREEQARQLRDLQTEVEGRHSAMQRATAEMADWSAAWSRMLASLGRPGDEPIAATENALDLIEELRKQEQEQRALAPRVADMQASIARFAAAAQQLVGMLAEDLAGVDPMQAATELARRAQAERERAVRADTLHRALLAAEQSAEVARLGAEAASRRLAGLRAALHAETDAAAEAQLLRARAAIAAEAALAEATAQLGAIGAGQPIAELEQLAAESDPDTEAVEAAELTEQLTALAGQVEALAAEQRSADEAMLRSEAETNTAAAASRRESGVAALSNAAEQALVLHAAICLLRAGLDRQRELSESGMVGRIGAAFNAITAGAYAGVTVEESGRGQRLVAVEADGGGRKQLDELSEGSRDQLYLALRIVALEEFAAGSPAPPFIADDVLQTFDDARTLASLRALVDLSRHVQVIAMTHHPHVAALAGSLPKGHVHIVAIREEAFQARA